MNNSINSKPMVIATLTDEAAQSALFNIDQNTIEALVGIVGGEAAFEEAGIDIADVPNDEGVTALFTQHQNAIVQFNQDLADLQGLESMGHLITKRDIGCDAGEINEARANLLSAEKGLNARLCVIRRALVGVVLEVMQDTYKNMSEA